MLKSNEEKIMGKLIRITLIALLASLLSALYISQVHAADVVPNEIQMPGTQRGAVGDFESPDRWRSQVGVMLAATSTDRATSTIQRETSLQ